MDTRRRHFLHYAVMSCLLLTLVSCSKQNPSFIESRTRPSVSSAAADAEPRVGQSSDSQGVVLTSLEVVPPVVTMPQGGLERLLAIGRFSDGSTKDLTEVVTWSTSRETVVSLNPRVDMERGSSKQSAKSSINGTVRGLGVGRAEVLAEFGQHVGKAVVNVVGGKLISVVVTPASVTMAKGNSRDFVAIARFDDGTEADVTLQASWTSDDPTVAAFESDPFLRGRLQAVGIGSVAAHATVQGVSGAIAVVVTPAVLVSIEVRPKVMELVLDGDTPARFSAIGIYSDSTESDITTAVLWDVADPAIASIANEPSKKGLVLGKSVGETVVTASLSGISSSADLQVLSPANPLVALTVNGSATGLVIPKRAGLAVAWRSQHATSCQAFRDGVVFDNRLAGESSVVADANTLFSIRCVNRLGVLATAEVPVVVTSPTVNLTVNNQTGPVTVFSGDTVSVSWTSAHAITCEARGDDTLIGRELAASDKRMLISKTTTFVVMCRDAMENLALASVTVLQHSLNVMVQAGNVETVPGSSINRPLAIYFALDVTGSMGGVISTVKTNIQAFVDELRAKRFDVRLGVIPFRDSIPSSTEVPEGRFDLSDDIDAFKTYVGGLRATGGGDGNEAGLIAIESALEELNTRETRADALKVILVITDNPSHRGAAAVNGQRDCAIGVTTNRFNAMPADVQKSVKLFYSAASGGQLCSGFSTAAGQFAALVSGALTAESDVAKRGGSIPWPFDATALVSTFAEMIQRTAPAIDLVCLNQSATLSMSPSLGGLVVNWSGNLSGVYADYKASRPVSVYSKVMTKAERDLFIGAAAHGDVDLEVTRCCVSRDSADRGDFATCHKTTRTNPGFAIEEL